MDEQHVEQMVRDAMDLHPPEGLRERVLGAALAQARPRPDERARWRAGRILPALAAALVIVSFGLDGARQERIARMTSGRAAGEALPVWAEMRRQTEALLVHLESGGSGSRKGG